MWYCQVTLCHLLPEYIVFGVLSIHNPQIQNTQGLLPSGLENIISHLSSSTRKRQMKIDEPDILLHLLAIVCLPRRSVDVIGCDSVSYLHAGVRT